MKSPVDKLRAESHARGPRLARKSLPGRDLPATVRPRLSRAIARRARFVAPRLGYRARRTFCKEGRLLSVIARAWQSGTSRDRAR
jgi:hypothetical protein